MSYGRNFGFRSPPVGAQRGSRYHISGSTAIAQGAPVLVADDATPDSTYDTLPADLATGDQAIPKAGMGGVAVYEHAQEAFFGSDAVITTPSDIDTIPVGRPCQVVGGKGSTKVWLKNTSATTFGTRSYSAQTMVAGLGATPTLAVGDYLTPGTGNFTAGYWAETTTAANGWLVITEVGSDYVEAVVNF